MTIEALTAGEALIVTSLAPLQAQVQPSKSIAADGDFGALLVQGLERANQALLQADQQAVQFALGANVPPHQVMLALEEARMQFQLAVQVRTKLLEGFQELMRMSL